MKLDFINYTNVNLYLPFLILKFCNAACSWSLYEGRCLGSWNLVNVYGGMLNRIAGFCIKVRIIATISEITPLDVLFFHRLFR